MQRYTVYFIWKLLYMFRVVPPPILRSANTCIYSLFLVFSLHVSGLHGPIIRGILSCCFYATIWFMQCFVGRLRASADWFVVVPSVYHHKPVR